MQKRVINTHHSLVAIGTGDYRIVFEPNVSDSFLSSGDEIEEEEEEREEEEEEREGDVEEEEEEEPRTRPPRYTCYLFSRSNWKSSP